MKKIRITKRVMTKVDLENDSTLGLSFVRTYLERRVGSLRLSRPKSGFAIVLEWVDRELSSRASGEEATGEHDSDAPVSREEPCRSFLLPMVWICDAELDLTDSLGTLLCVRSELYEYGSGATNEKLAELESEIQRRWDKVFAPDGKEAAAA